MEENSLFGTPGSIENTATNAGVGFEFQLPKNKSSIIKVIGVGGGGGNAVNTMFNKGIKGVDFVICNTDEQALRMSPIPNKLRLGNNQTEGLGAGSDPEVGRRAALESIEDIREILKVNTKMVFITAGMGGGTGTGAAPEIAKLAKEMGILTVAIVTTPFGFEGKKRMVQAQAGIDLLEGCVDTLIVINNSNLSKLFDKKVTMKHAFEEADNVLCEAAKGIAEIITIEGFINVDFADVNTVMKNGGTALMGTGVFEGEERGIMAVEKAISSPLLDNINIFGSKQVLVNIKAHPDSFGLDDMEVIGNYIKEAAGDQANIIVGAVFDEKMGESLSATVIATGFDKGKPAFEESVIPKKEEPKERLAVDEIKKDENHLGLNNKPKEEVIEEDLVLFERGRVLRELDWRDLDQRNKMEDQPAIERNAGLSIHPEDDQGLMRSSGLTIDQNLNRRSGTEINEDNRFLHDNVD